MKRRLLIELVHWKNLSTRKPLLLRGARQVGKTHLVRQLGKRFEKYIEINFEKNPDLKIIFGHDLDAIRIIKELSIVLKTKIEPGKTLLFLDEIQEAPKAIIALRYFYEDLSQLHVIAGGLQSIRLFFDTHTQSSHGIRFSIHNYSIFDKIHSYPPLCCSRHYR